MCFHGTYFLHGHQPACTMPYQSVSQNHSLAYLGYGGRVGQCKYDVPGSRTRNYTPPHPFQ